MKIITIGRGENSHIFIDNPLVSRQHAILKIYGSGKMTIVDKSSNGTSINGSPIKRERECPVSRRDVVTFAGVSQLDWKEVPDPLKVYKIIGLVLAGLAVALGLFFGIKALIPEKEVAPDENTPAVTTPTPVNESKPADTGSKAKQADPSKTQVEEPEDLDKVLKDMKKAEQSSGSKANNKKDKEKEKAEKEKAEKEKAEKEKAEKEKPKENNNNNNFDLFD